MLKFEEDLGKLWQKIISTENPAKNALPEVANQAKLYNRSKPWYMLIRNFWLLLLKIHFWSGDWEHFRFSEYFPIL